MIAALRQKDERAVDDGTGPAGFVTRAS